MSANNTSFCAVNTKWKKLKKSEQTTSVLSSCLEQRLLAQYNLPHRVPLLPYMTFTTLSHMSKLTLMWKHKLSGSWILQGLHTSDESESSPKQTQLLWGRWRALQRRTKKKKTLRYQVWWDLCSRHKTLCETKLLSVQPAHCLDFWEWTEFSKDVGNRLNGCRDNMTSPVS